MNAKMTTPLEECDQKSDKRERFEFGKNWQRFLLILNDERIAQAQKSLLDMLEIENLSGKSFLDIGCGSGLFSLVARRLGAKVHSFDYDQQAVACTQELKRRYFANDPNWSIEQASVLDIDYIKSLGRYDIVYSWGVLHHTGQMWKALEQAQIPVRQGGYLYIAIYNNQGNKSKIWKAIKRTYNRLPGFLRLPFVILVMLPFEGGRALLSLIKLRPLAYINSWTLYRRQRGMSRWHDLIDWVGGYPFEVAKPEEIFDYYRPLGFVLQRLKTCGGGLGCNEFVFRRIQE
jgi:2-polyprenyl-6-hydroxyphenyl methylase/3-demethylubiquinone-9 3-methyltransferase